MSEPATETPPAETGPGEDRMDRIEDKVDKLAAAVSKLIPGSHAEAEDRVESRLDRSSTVEEQVRAELDKAKREQEAAAAADADKAERETVGQRLARLEEKPPQPPVRRATKLLGWGS